MTSPRTRLAQLGRMVLKEEREILRDPRTLATLFVMPLLLYPLLSYTVQQFLLAGARGTPEIRYLFGVGSPGEARIVESVLHRAGPTGPPPKRDAGPLGMLVSPKEKAESTPVVNWRLEILPGAPLPELVAAGRLDVGIVVKRVKDEADPRGETAVDFLFHFAPDAAMSEQALEFLQERCHTAGVNILYEKLRRLGGRQRFKAVQVERQAVETPAARGNLLAAILPLVLILMTITGAVYPAIDLTAGERERGTLEILVCAPVSRYRLLFAKYVAVLTVALLTAAVNLAAMALTVLLGDLGPLLFTAGGLSAGLVAQAAFALALFAAFFSAVLLALTSHARSFKEAQSYLIPLMLAALAPGLMSLMPSVQLTWGVALAPLLNIVLLARDLLQTGATPPAAPLVLLSTAVYGAIALAAAARAFGSEGVLYGQSAAGWGDLVRRGAESRPAVPPATAVGVVLAILPLVLLANGAAEWIAAGDLRRLLVANAVVLAILYGGLPLAVVWHRHVERRALRTGRFPWVALPAAALLGLSLWAWAAELQVWQGEWQVVTFTAEMRARAEEVAASLRAMPTWLLLVVMAVVPAVVEELCFRGFLFGAFADRGRPFVGVVVSALLFGLFHVTTPHVLSPARFLPTTALGVVLAILCWRSGSVWPGVLLHALHNGFVTLLIANPDAAGRMLAPFGELTASQRLPPALLATTAGVAAIGAVLLAFVRPRNATAAAPPPR